MVRSLRSETECLRLVLSSSCDIVPVTCSLVLPSVLVLDLLALRSIPHPSLLVLMSQRGWPWNLCFLGSYTNQLTSGWVSLVGCTGARLEGGEKGRARVFSLLSAGLLSQAEALSLSWPPAHNDSSFSQVTLAFGHLALSFLFMGW